MDEDKDKFLGIVEVWDIGGEGEEDYWFGYPGGENLTPHIQEVIDVQTGKRDEDYSVVEEKESKEEKRRIKEDAIKYDVSEATIREWWKDAMEWRPSRKDIAQDILPTVKDFMEKIEDLTGITPIGLKVLFAPEDIEEEDEETLENQRDIDQIAIVYFLRAKRGFPFWEDVKEMMENTKKTFNTCIKIVKEKRAEERAMVKVREELISEILADVMGMGVNPGNEEEEIREMEEAAFSAFGEVLEIIRGISPDKINVRYPTGDIVDASKP